MKQYTQFVPVDWEEQFFDLNTGIKMACTMCGPVEGLPVVLLHGVTDGRLAWIRIAPELAKRGLRVYVPEMRGNGLTDKPQAGTEGYPMALHAQDILALLNVLGIKRAHVVGHSMGSLVAQEINLAAPERVLSTTLMDSTACCQDNPVLNWMLYGDGAKFGGVVGYKDSGMPEEFLRAWANASLETEDYQNGMLAHISQIPFHGWINLMTGLIDFDSRDRLSKISGRVQLVWADGDDTFPEADQKILLAGLTGCQLRYQVISGAGHDVMRDTPQARKQVVDILVSFILESPCSA